MFFRMKRRYGKYQAVVGSNDFQNYKARSSENAQNSLESGVPLSSRKVYLSLVDHMFRSSRYEVVPLGDLMEDGELDRTRVALRHDVDADPEMALWIARCLAMHGMPGTFFLLHNSSYWGLWEGGSFRRNPQVREFVRALIITGVEIGLHIDPLGIERQHGVSGIDSVREELRWLREHGAQVDGVVAHNSAAAYGAENFEVFKGLAAANRRRINYEGCSHKLQVASLQELGIRYEGNHPLPRKTLPDLTESFFSPPEDAVRNEAWLNQYLCHHPIFERRYDHDIWILGDDLWAYARHGVVEEFSFPITFQQMLGKLDQCGLGERVVITIHPMYFAGQE